METLTYRGLWIENFPLSEESHEEQRHLVATARHLVNIQNRLNTGAFIPSAQAHLLAADVRTTANVHGEFQWWQIPSNPS